VVIYNRLLFLDFFYHNLHLNNYTNTMLNAHAPVCLLYPKPTDTHTHTHTQVSLFL